MRVTTIGLDPAKTVFQVHDADGRGRVVFRKRLTGSKLLAFFANLPMCVVGMEASAGPIIGRGNFEGSAMRCG